MFLQSAAWRATSGRRGACNAGETRTLLEFSPAYHGSAMAECKAQMRTGLAPSGQQEPDSWCCGQPLIHKHSNAGGLRRWCTDNGDGVPGWEDWYDEETGEDDPAAWLEAANVQGQGGDKA